MQLVWSVLSTILFTTYIFHLKRPIHPGYPLASDLLIWLAISLLAPWTMIFAVFWDYVDPTLTTYHDPVRRTTGMLELVAISFLMASL